MQPKRYTLRNGRSLDLRSLPAAESLYIAWLLERLRTGASYHEVLVAVSAPGAFPLGGVPQFRTEADDGRSKDREEPRRRRTGGTPTTSDEASRREAKSADGRNKGHHPGGRPQANLEARKTALFQVAHDILARAAEQQGLAAKDVQAAEPGVYHSVTEAAKALHISRAAVVQAIHERRLAAYRLG